MLDPLRLKLQTEGSLDLLLRVRPHSDRTEVIDILEDGSLKVHVAAPAEDGRGNAMLLKYMAQEFQVPLANVKILSGKGARLKLVRVRAENR